MRLRYIYGPVSSWRLGRSLGIDLLSQKNKVCTFNCGYCQLGDSRGKFSLKRKVYVKTKDLIDELKKLSDVKVDYITFAGCGEPTLAKNLGQAIREVKKMRKEKVAVITNSSLMHLKSVRKELSFADIVSAKLDAPTIEIFKKVSRPDKNIKFSNVLKGLREFRKEYKGEFNIQIMFTDQNQHSAEEIAVLARSIKPDCVEINTPLRPSKVKPLTKSQIRRIKVYFKGLPVITVYGDAKRKRTRALSGKSTVKRRGKTA